MIRRAAVAGAIAGVWVWTLDLAGWLATTPGAAGGASWLGVAGGLGLAALAGGGIATLAGALVRLARTPGPAARFSVDVLASAGRSASRTISGAVLAALALAAAVPLRAWLLGRARLAAAVDVAAAVAALLLFAAGTRLGRRVRPLEVGPRALGAVFAAAAVAVSAAGALLRPFLLPRGLLDLVDIAALGAAGIAAFALVPLGASRRAAAWAIPLVPGLAAVLLLQVSERARSGPAVEVRPASWMAVEAASLVDLDGDGFTPLFGGGDCDDFDSRRNPDAVQIPGNGIDENCSGHDSLARLPWPARPSFVPLPAGIRPPRSIFLVTIDSLRQDRLGAYGYTKGTTPNLDRFARGAVLFRNAYTGGPTTRVAMPMLVTGRYQPQIRWNRALYPWGISEANETIGEIFRAAGFRTAAFPTAWTFRREWGYVQGFEHVDVRLANDLSKVYTAVTSPELVAHALEWIEAHRAERMFVWMHLFDPHINYVRHPDVPDFGPGQAGLYDGEVFYTDRALGTFFQRLDALGLADDSAIVLHADHGEMLGEHGLTVHGQTIWEETARIPLLVRVPGVGGRRVDCVTSHIDVPPTLLNLAGIDAGRHGMAGATLVGDLVGPCDPAREIVTEVRYPGTRRALVGPRWKLVEDTRLGRVQLYDLAHDPHELRDVSARFMDVARAMRRRLHDWAEYTAGREYADTLQAVVVHRIPDEAERVLVRWPNGIRLLGIDLGRRHVDLTHNLRVRFYFDVQKIPKADCTLDVRFTSGGRAMEVAGDGEHVPAYGLLPFPRFPRRAVVEDEFNLRYDGRKGRFDATLALRCGGRPLAAAAGPHVTADGKVDLGVVEVRGLVRGARRTP